MKKVKSGSDISFSFNVKVTDKTTVDEIIREASDIIKVRFAEYKVEPEESEDEKIRRTLVEYFGPEAQLDFIRGVKIQKIRDWLEKQKEQKTDAKSERVIKAARSVLNNWLDGTDCPDVSGDFTELEYAIREYDGEEKQKEQKPISVEEVLARAGLKPYKDGNQWCILAGDNIQEGICGFGDTIDEALYQFLMEVLEKRKEQKPAEWSEDEQTRKRLIDFISNIKAISESGRNSLAIRKDDAEMCDAFLSYIEKQKDHFRDDTKMVEKQDYSGLNDLEQAIHRGFLSAGVENVPAAIIKETANECKRIANENANAEWSEEDKIIVGCIVCYLDGQFVSDAARKQCLEWFNKHRRDFLNQSRQEWSEADEDIRDTIIRDLKRLGGDIANVKPAYQKEIAWLKSLRPQSHWKPSEEQMRALIAIICLGEISYVGQEEELISLKNNLKKLM